MSQHVTSCRNMSCHATTCHTMLQHFTSCHNMSRMPQHVTHATTCHVTPKHVTSCHNMSRHATTCHVLPQHRHVTSRLIPSISFKLDVFPPSVFPLFMMFLWKLCMYTASAAIKILRWLISYGGAWIMFCLVPSQPSKTFRATWGNCKKKIFVSDCLSFGKKIYLYDDWYE